ETGDPYLMRVTTTAELPSGDSEESDHEDTEEPNRDEELKEKLKAAEKLQGITFQVTKYTVDALLKSRQELLQDESPSSSQSQARTGSTPPPMLRPPTTPLPQRRAQAVTPPISVPPAPKAEDSTENDGSKENPSTGADSSEETSD
ncbi:MAG: hypothetical protein ACQKBU_07185, partial [Verrucomicrobiales bacterium]